MATPAGRQLLLDEPGEQGGATAAQPVGASAAAAGAGSKEAPAASSAAAGRPNVEPAAPAAGTAVNDDRRRCSSRLQGGSANAALQPSQGAAVSEVGFVNTGTDCFANALAQIFLRTPGFTELITGCAPFAPDLQTGEGVGRERTLSHIGYLNHILTLTLPRDAFYRAGRLWPLGRSPRAFPTHTRHSQRGRVPGSYSGPSSAAPCRR